MQMARKTIIKKKAEKVWYDIIAPGMFGDKNIGTTTASNKDHLEKRILRIPLNELTGNFRQFYINIALRIRSVKDNKAITEYDGQDIREDKILRLVNRWSSRIDSIDDIDTKDNIKIRIKSLTVTRRKVNTTVKGKIRALLSAKIIEFCKDRKLDQIINSINNEELQRSISKEAKKIYPLKAVEIRKIKVMPQKKRHITKVLENPSITEGEKDAKQVVEA